jgi:phenolic acid decarboxylase
LRKKSRLSWFILAVFMMTIAFGGVMPNAVSAANLTDVQGHWAAAQINAMVDQGIVAGYPNNTFKPNANITRAEFIVLSNKSFAFSNTAEINYSDVKSSDWFANDIAKAKAAGYISGYEDGTMKPNNNISRQEAAVIVANILKLNSAGSDELKKFKDASSIPAWSASSVAALVKGGILAGYPDGTFQPKKAITRAEAVVILTKAKGTTTPSKLEPGIDLSKISKAGTYGPATGNQAISGDVTISASGVTLQNATVSGDLTITDVVGNGDVTLKNVTVKGTAYIKGGGANSIHLNSCVFGKVVINKADGKLRVTLEGSTSISQLVADSAVTVAGKGTITKAVINKAGVVIETEPGSITFGATGITALINNKTVSAPSRGGGGGGGGTGGITQISAKTYAQCKAAGATWVTNNFNGQDFIYVGQTGFNLDLLFNNADSTTTYTVTGANADDYSLMNRNFLKATVTLPVSTEVTVTASKANGGTASIKVVLGLNVANTTLGGEAIVYTINQIPVQPVSVKTYAQCKAAGATWITNNFSGQHLIYIGQQGLSLDLLFNNADTTTTYSLTGVGVSDYSLTGRSNLQATANLAVSTEVTVTATKTNGGTASIKVLLGLNTANSPSGGESIVYTVAGTSVGPPPVVTPVLAKTFAQCKVAGATWVTNNFSGQNCIYVGQQGLNLDLLFNNADATTTYSLTGAGASDYSLTGRSSLKATGSLAIATEVTITATKTNGGNASIKVVLGLSTANNPSGGEAIVYSVN